MKKDKITNEHLGILNDYRKSIIDRNHFAFWSCLSERTKWFFLGTYHKGIDKSFSLPSEGENYLSSIIEQIIDSLYELYGDEYIVDGGVSNLIRYPNEETIAIGEIFVLSNIKTEIHLIAKTEVMVWKIPICLEINIQGGLNWKIDLVRKMIN